ncbi:hypothetical protein VCR3J2_170002 [Vibrio coralliirubri]|nr:hypothetical protein VCR3J2_170002 [Vibrio coralliirubri]
MSQVQVLQGEPIKRSRIIDAAFLHLKILTSQYNYPHLSNTIFNSELTVFISFKRYKSSLLDALQYLPTTNAPFT